MIAGKDKGVEGKVIEVIREADRVIVEGVQRGQAAHEGDAAGRPRRQHRRHHHQEAPIHVSNVMLVDGKATTRVGLQARRGRRSVVRTARRTPRSAACRVSRTDRGGDLMTASTRQDGTAGRDPTCRRGSSRRTATRSCPRCTSSSATRTSCRCPRLTKIVVNMGVGEAARDSKLIEGAVRDLTLITGQKPQVTKARKSIAQFKLREGMPIGAHVTLRGDRMWEFLDRLLTLALPRIRDFRGLSDRQFDGKGNYTFGLTEQVMFHEIDQDQHRPLPGHGHHGRDHRDQRRRGPGPAEAARLSLQGGN